MCNYGSKRLYIHDRIICVIFFWVCYEMITIYKLDENTNTCGDVNKCNTYAYISIQYAHNKWQF